MSLEFRFGAFGYLAHPALLAEGDAAANLGLSDQLFGLDWVRRNIGYFGGDPQRITIFGQSSGATDICALMTAPAAKDRFTRAILDSIPYGCEISTLASMKEAALETAQRVGCTQTDPAEVANCLRALPKEDLLNATKAAAGRPALTYEPWVDGEFLSQDPAVALRECTGKHVSQVPSALPMHLARNQRTLNPRPEWASITHLRGNDDEE